MTIKRGKPLVPHYVKPVIAYEEPENVPALYKSIPGNVIEIILEKIGINLSPKEACAMVGISFSYFSQLMRDNIEGLADKVECARLLMKELHLKEIHDPGKYWKASAWYLERTDRETYGKEVTITGKNVGDEQVLRIGDKEIKF